MKHNLDDLADAVQIAQAVLVIWACAVAGCVGAWLLWRGWAAFWTAFAQLYWLQMR